MRKSISLFMLACVLFAGQSKAQVDPHFSQYYAYPLWLNPGLTGAMDASYRVTLLHRSQWAGITNPFSTFGATADFIAGKKMNFGASILNQTAGDGGYNYLTANVSLAYTGLQFDPEGYKRIAIGMQLGVLSRKFNPTKFQFGDQWNPITGYDPTIQTADVLTKTSSSVFDVGAGAVYYDGTPGKKANLFLGFAAGHLTQPDDPFITGPTKQKLPIRITAHGGVRLALSDQISITPNALFMQQGSAQEKMLGAFAQIKAATTLDLLLGANYRFDDAFSPYAGFIYKNFSLGASYDVNTSQLGKMAGGANSFEISLTFYGNKSYKYPSAQFICPRL